MSSAGSLCVSHAATGGGPLWKFSSLGIRIDGWRLTYHRSFDVAAFCEPMIINDGRHCPRYGRLCGPWHRHGRFGSRSPGFALLFSLGLVWLSVPFSLFRHVLTCGGMRHCVWSGSLHTPEALLGHLAGQQYNAPGPCSNEPQPGPPQRRQATGQQLRESAVRPPVPHRPAKQGPTARPGAGASAMRRRSW